MYVLSLELRVGDWGSPNSDDWRKSLALCLLSAYYIWSDTSTLHDNTTVTISPLPPPSSAERKIVQNGENARALYEAQVKPLS